MVKSSPTKLSWKKCPNPSRHQPLLLPDVCGISLIRPHFEREQRPNVFVDLVFQTRWCNSPLFRDSLSSKSHNPQNPHIKPHKKIRFACSFRQKSEEQEWKISVMDTPGWSDSPKCDLPTLFFLFGLTWDLIFWGKLNFAFFVCLLIPSSWRFGKNLHNSDEPFGGLKLGGSKPSDFFWGWKIATPVSVFEGFGTEKKCCGLHTRNKHIAFI